MDKKTVNEANEQLKKHNIILELKIAPIRLQVGFNRLDKNGKNIGFGILHHC